MSAPTAMQSFGNKNLNGGQVTYMQVQVYASVTALNADSATATGRIVYVAENNTFYLGFPTGWVALTP